MADRIVGMAGHRLATSEVVERRRVATRLERLATPVDHVLVLAGFVCGMELGPDLPATDLERLSDLAADRDHRRPCLDGERCPVSARLHEHERAGRCVDGVAVDLEPRVTAEDDVELLAALVLLVLGHEPVAHARGRPGVRAECGDPEVVPNRSHVRLLPVVDVLHLIHGRDPVLHEVLLTLVDTADLRP